MGFEASSEMMINMRKEDIPAWDTKRSYFDQSTDVLQFYEEEFNKITRGVNIGGYRVHPWLYFHLNVYKTPIPIRNSYGEDDQVIQHPPLDDNILYITESYEEAKLRNKILFLFGTRGFTKSSAISSLTQQTILTKPNGVFSILGGSADDLKNISSLMETTFGHVDPAFFLPTIKKKWETYVQFGYKEKNGHNMVHSEIFVTNINKGTSKNSEKGAGLSPIGFVLDEAGKFNFLKVLESALPGFKTQHGFKLVPVLSGTGGNNVLSQDAREVLSNPDANNILPMNWDRLNRFVPEEFITWKEDMKSTFGTFVPGQMTYREAIPRVEKSLSKVLNIKGNKQLDKIKVQTTNWEVGNEVIKNLVDSQKKEAGKNKNKMYYPTKLAHCFLTDSPNPFPVEVIERQIEKLESAGNIGKSVKIYKDGSSSKYQFSDKTRAQISHPGGPVDAPIVLHTDLPEFPPEKFFFVSGLDDYKLNVSETDSLGSLYVLRRRNMAPDQPCELIEACYTSRPERHKDFHGKCDTIITTWNAECLIESADTSFETYLDDRGRAYQYLAPAITFANKKNKAPSANLYGLYPTTQNNEYRFNLMVEAMWEEYVTGIDEYGNRIVKYGAEFITCVELLKEMRDWKKTGNFDRIAAYSHALVHSRYLDSQGIRPKTKKEHDMQKIIEAQKKGKNGISKYTTTRFNPYS